MVLHELKVFCPCSGKVKDFTVYLSSEEKIRLIGECEKCGTGVFANFALDSLPIPDDPEYWPIELGVSNVS